MDIVTITSNTTILYIWRTYYKSNEKFVVGLTNKSEDRIGKIHQDGKKIASRYKGIKIYTIADFTNQTPRYFKLSNCGVESETYIIRNKSKYET